MPFAVPDEMDTPFAYLYQRHPAFAAVLMDAPLRIELVDAPIPSTQNPAGKPPSRERQAPSGQAGEPFFARTYAKCIDFNRDWLKTLGYKQASFVLAHEIVHYMMAHSELLYKWVRDGSVTGRINNHVITHPFDMATAQKTLDYSVNDALLKCGLRDYPVETMTAPIHDAWTMDEADLYVLTYTMNPPPQPQPQPQQGQGQGQGQAGKPPSNPSNQDPSDPNSTDNQPTDNGDVGSPGDQPGSNPGNNPGNGANPGNGGWDVLPTDPAKSTDDAGRRQAVIRRALAQVVTDKSRGMGAGDVERFVEKICPTKVDWRDVVRPRLQHVIGRDSKTWFRPRRDGLAANAILQGTVGRRAGTVCVVADTSGSIGRQEQEKYVYGLLDMFQTNRPKKLVLLEIDSMVRRSRECTKISDLRQMLDVAGKQQAKGQVGAFIGGGGTDMRMADHWLKENSLTPDVTVFLTDGYTPYPTGLGNSKRVVWVMTTSQKAPEKAGETVRMW